MASRVLLVMRSVTVLLVGHGTGALEWYKERRMIESTSFYILMSCELAFMTRQVDRFAGIPSLCCECSVLHKAVAGKGFQF